MLTAPPALAAAQPQTVVVGNGFSAPVFVASPVPGSVVVRGALGGQHLFADHGSDRMWSVAANGSFQSMASTTEWTSVPAAATGRAG